tara:strand:+ start:267 stop:893 length:627 start_codon:yes stop_codon:yes gene_type:complete
MSNLELWNKVCKTDPRHTKKANVGGNKITSICPQYQRMNATEQFGSFGDGWGVIDEMFSTKDFHDGTVLGSYNAKFWYILESDKKSFPIYSNTKVAFNTASGKYKIDEDWMKKCATDALTKGLSALGFNADIFLGKFDDNKYVQQVGQEAQEEDQRKAYVPILLAIDLINSCKAIDDLKKTWGSLTKPVAANPQVGKAKDDKKAELSK